MRRLLVSVLLVACACSSGGDVALACNHFRNVSNDAAGGLLTNQELREKLKEVNKDAAIASSAVQEASREMLRAATANDSQALRVAINKMDQACS